jgi:hypothetical protein
MSWYRWPHLRRINEAPDRIDALEKRVAELENKLQRAPGEACPHCGALEYRVDRTERDPGPLGALGARKRHMKCGACGFAEIVIK